MTGSELFILLVFFVFIAWVLIKPEGILELQKRVYKLIGIEINYSAKGKMFVRIAALCALLIGLFGFYNTFH